MVRFPLPYFIAYQVTEVRKAILSIRLDIKRFEDKYQLSTKEFYQNFISGKADDTEDMIVWTSVYEMLLDNEVH